MFRSSNKSMRRSDDVKGETVALRPMEKNCAQTETGRCGAAKRWQALAEARSKKAQGSGVDRGN